METRDEKYRKHIVEEQGKFVQNTSKQFGASPYTVISANPSAFHYTLLDHIGNTPSSWPWPYFAYANLYQSCGTDILDSTEEFLNYLTYNQHEFRNLTWGPAYNPLAFSHPRATVQMNPLRSRLCHLVRFTFTLFKSIPLKSCWMQQRWGCYVEDEGAKSLVTVCPLIIS